MIDSGMTGMGRGLIVLGLLVAAAGAVLLLAPKLPWIGKLPGDIFIQRPGFRFYFPLATCLAASAVLSLIAWIMNRFR